MRISCAAALAFLALTPVPSLAYDMMESMKDAESCSGKGTSVAASIAAACTRLIENIDGSVLPSLKEDLDLYYLYRSFAHDDAGNKEKACADALKALELMPKAKASRDKWTASAERVKQANC